MLATQRRGSRPWSPFSCTPVSYAAVIDGPDVAVFAVRETTRPLRRSQRLHDRVREAIRTRHYSRRTEKTYVAWIRRYFTLDG
jgi:hypothetical protein